jgi:dihydrofolate synthase/folylpolyglutamate synthase
MKFERYFKAVRFLEGLSNLPLPRDYSEDYKHSEGHLRRMRYFLELLGNPDKHFKFIHITGTAGKGSVAQMMQEVLIASGKNTGLFTSPFTTTSIEKIRVNNKYIAPDEFADIVESLKPYINKAYAKCPYGGPSYFELFFAIALVYFARKKCEWVVCEVGCGGRHDMTNVIKCPVIAAITNINFDHMNVLGRTLKKIAYEKAGIIKNGSIFFTSETRPRLLKIFQETCRENKAEFNALKGLVSANEDELSRGGGLHLQGNHQFLNASLVTAMAKYLGIKEQDIIRGISAARLPCRFEIMQKAPLVVLDGAHNEVKMKSVVTNIKKLKFNKLFLIIGIAYNKEINDILPLIIPLADYIFATRFQINERKCYQPAELAKLSAPYKQPKAKIEVYYDPKQALSKALELASLKDCVLATGSFFLTGELREKWYSEEWVLKKRSSF